MKTISNLEVTNMVGDWLGIGYYDLLQVWEQDNTYFVVAAGTKGMIKNVLYFLRIFPTSNNPHGKYYLSQDGAYEMSAKRSILFER
jgi:hypothetical protein